MTSLQAWWDGLNEASKIAIIAAIIAFFGGLLVAFINAAFNRAAAKVGRTPLGSSLEIVDVVVIQEAGSAPMMLEDSTTLDIKVRNKGDQVAFIKSAVLHVSESEMINFLVSSKRGADLCYVRCRFTGAAPVKAIYYQSSLVPGGEGK